MSVRVVLTLLAISVYVASLLLPAMKAGGNTTQGLDALILGPMAVFTGEFRWVVNPLFIAGCVLAFLEKRPTWPAVAVTSVAVLLSLSCVFFPVTLLTGDSGSPSRSFAMLLSGAYAWIAAQLMLAAAVLVPKMSASS
jgi:hypothetical protein